MSMIYEDNNRQAVPRCLPYETACSLGLLRVNRKIEQLYKPDVNNSNAMQEWIENRRLATAVDLVAEALIIRDFESSEAIAAAKLILSKAPSSSSLVRQLANHFLQTTTSRWTDPSNLLDVNAVRKYIARLKKSVRNYLYNPIAWSNLSLGYATVEQNEKAKMTMSVAMNLAKNNRYILRSAARCFMHLGEPDRGLAMLNKSGLCAIDPWITSAEIAISESSGLKSKCIGKAKDLIKDDNLTPFSRSELAVGLGTMEIKSGAISQGKKVMRVALVEPTENALAQVEWVGSYFKVNFDDLFKLRSEVPATYEATAVHLYFDKKFKESLKASKKWGRFQAMSPHPIILSTSISSSLLDDDLGAIEIFDNAFPSQRNSPLAINNYAFALARIGRTEEARNKLSQGISDASREEVFTITATNGLVCFREGDIEGGRILYDNAVKGFEILQNYRSAAVATYFWAAEEKRVKSQGAEAKIKEAKKRIEQRNVFEYEDLVKKL